MQTHLFLATREWDRLSLVAVTAVWSGGLQRGPSEWNLRSAM